ncbi:MAG TPA: dynamin family protein [Candidatus Baltobacteraceae bacterium]|nr:dynamin family protein [Candidatus Baltobacteraceae bacterium]
MSRVDADAMHRYEATRDELVARLLAVEENVGAERRAAIARTRARLERGKFVLAVVGEFSSGKSFLLNAMLGKFRYEETGSGKTLVGLLATDINPSTATITELDYGPRDEATAFFEDGRTERIPLDRLSRFIAVGNGEAGTLHEATEDRSGAGQTNDAPARVVVATNSSFLERGIVVADTPGLASINPAHRRATLHFLPSADAVLYLIDTQQPFTEGDASFLGIIREHIDSIFIVQTKIDLWQQRQSDGRAAWEAAYDRIATLAAVHAPGTYVYALSAREYVEGLLGDDAERVDKSHFQQFLSALDASLIRRTGRARLGRVRDRVSSHVADARAQIEADLAMLGLDEGRLSARRSEVLPKLSELDAQTRALREAVLSAALALRSATNDRGAELARDLERALSQAFDAADVARLRDRARLHMLVDRVVAKEAGEFARDVARRVRDQIGESLERAEAILPVRFSPNDAAARAFGAQPGTSLWNGDVASAIAATIVLDAIGGPAIALVHDIATRFAGRQSGAYMKRELIADLRSEIFPRFETEVEAFADRIGACLARLYDDLAQALSAAMLAKRDADVGSIDRALAARSGGTVEEVGARLKRQSDTLNRELDAIRKIVAEFMEHEEEIAPADPGSEAVRMAHTDYSFDQKIYDRGLRPSRWRVAILGALRRGKTSLINAFAGKTVLTDDVAGSVRFPIHVRYGERDEAFALAADGEWREIPFESATREAASAPVLVLVPWSLPHELVLVHAPAFDSGDPSAEDVNVVVASHASEVLCLFSRQLSDRELQLYDRIAEFDRPMLFAHTIADNEAPNERRHVVELAQSYLRQRNIAAERVFVVSAHEYDQAKRERRAPAGWNETEALRSTLEAHAEAHMARLARLARASVASPAEASITAVQTKQKDGFFSRIFRKGR